jgi:uncharacterized membrane protein YesL
MIWREPPDAARVIRRSVRDGWDALFIVGALNLAWLALSLTVILLPPATVALFESMDGLASGRTPDVRDFFGSIRRRFVGAWVWALWAVAGLTIALVNVRYWNDTGGSLAWLSAAFVVLGALFAVSVLFVWPFVFRQTEGGLGRAIRNSVLAVLAAPLYALSLALLMVALVAISAVLILPLAFFLMALVGLVASHAVTDRLRAFGKLPARPSIDETEQEGG